MFKTLFLAVATLALGAGALVPAAADAQRGGGRYDRAYGHAYDDGYNQRGYDQRRHNRRGYRGERCNSGTTGTIVGAIAGGLLGRSVDRRGDRAVGTVLGGAAGALAGNAIGKSNNPGYCRR